MLTEVTVIDLPTRPGGPRGPGVTIEVAELGATNSRIKAAGLTVTAAETNSGREFRFMRQGFVDFVGQVAVLYQLINDWSRRAPGHAYGLASVIGSDRLQPGSH